jgi:hypothetical protein
VIVAIMVALALTARWVPTLSVEDQPTTLPDEA